MASINISGLHSPGYTLTLTFSGLAAGNKHSLVWSIGEYSTTQELAAGVSAISFTIPISWLGAFPNSSKGTMRLSVYAINGATSTWVTGYVSDITAASNAAPTMSALSTTRIDNGVPAGWGVYVNGISKALVTIPLTTGQYGAIIGSYKITSIWSGQQVHNALSNTFETDPLSMGTYTFTGTVTDSRGLQSSKTTSISVLDYSAPKITAASYFRCNSVGTATADGTYILVKVNYSFSSVSSKNSATCQVQYRKGSTGGLSALQTISNNVALIIGSGSIATDSPYEVVVTIKDAIQSVVQVLPIEGGTYAIHLKKGGLGVAFGQGATEDNVVAVKESWTLKAGAINAKSLTLTNALPASSGGTGQTSLQATRNAMGLGNTTGALPVANGGTGQSTIMGAFTALTHRGNTADMSTALSAGTYGHANNAVNTPITSSYGAMLNIVNDGGTHNNSNNWIWQLAVNTSINTLYMRMKVNSGAFTSWATFLNSANYSQYVLPLTGGTLTDMLYFSDPGIGVGRKRGIQGTVADNDYWRVVGGNDSSNAGYLELAAADDGTEPIYVRQYSGVFATQVRQAALLDVSGNTSFPGTVSAARFSGPLTGDVVGRASGNLSNMGDRVYGTIYNSMTGAALVLDGYNEQQIMFQNASSAGRTAYFYSGSSSSSTVVGLYDSSVGGVWAHSSDGYFYIQRPLSVPHGITANLYGNATTASSASSATWASLLTPINNASASASTWPNKGTPVWGQRFSHPNSGSDTGDMTWFLLPDSGGGGASLNIAIDGNYYARVDQKKVLHTGDVKGGQFTATGVPGGGYKDFTINHGLDWEPVSAVANLAHTSSSQNVITTYVIAKSATTLTIRVVKTSANAADMNVNWIAAVW